MRKTFVSNASASMQQYAQQGKKHEYWFAVPQERSVLPPSENTRQIAVLPVDFACSTFCALNIDGCSYSAHFRLKPIK